MIELDYTKYKIIYINLDFRAILYIDLDENNDFIFACGDLYNLEGDYLGEYECPYKDLDKYRIDVFDSIPKDNPYINNFLLNTIIDSINYINQNKLL